MRRDGKSLGQMAKEEIGPFTGILAMIAILAIMVILLAVLALVVVKALAESPWGVFTILCTIPIALGMGFWMKVVRPGKTLEATAAGIVLLLLALVAGRWVAASPTLAPMFTLSATTISWGLMGYGFIASVLPVWMLLAPRDYLSTFVKIGTIVGARVRHHAHAADAAASGVHPVRRRHRPGLRRQALPVLLHHDRVRRDLRVPRAGVQRHDAQDARPGDRRARHRLRRDADGVVRRGDGDVRGDASSIPASTSR